MTKADLVEQVSLRTGLKKRDVQVVVDGFLSAIGRSLEEGGSVELRGFGSFKTRLVPERSARNPRTGEGVLLPEREVPLFKPSRKLRDMIEKGG